MRPYDNEREHPNPPNRPIFWFMSGGFLAGYAKSKVNVDVDFLVRFVPGSREVGNRAWRLEHDEKAYLLVEEAARTGYLDPMLDYLIEKGLPDWAIDYIRG